MISTGNVELDAAFAEMQRQISDLSSECAAKAGKIAVLQARVAELEKPIGIAKTAS